MRWACLCAGVVIATVFAGSGCSERNASPRRESIGDTAQAIQDGTTDTTSLFAVGVCDGAAGKCSGVCSGALILPNVVATARHCVDQTPELIKCADSPRFGKPRANTYSVTTNTTIEPAGSGWYAVTSIAVPDDDHICGNDLALLVLSKSIPAAVTAPITPAVQYLMWDPAADYAMSFTAIGYGNTSPAGEGSGTRRSRDYIDVLCVPGSPDYPCPADGGFNPNEFVASGGTCSGDSGSSAFETLSMMDAKPVSFGVLSRGDDSSGVCGQAIYSRFDAHRDFVLQIAKQASNNWTLYPEPSWTTEKPQPSTTDPGTTKKDGGTTAKPAGTLGDSCANTKDCASGVCTDEGDGALVCSQACDEADASCPDGFECRESLCLPPLAVTDPGATPRKVTTTGCATTPSSSAGLPWATMAIALGAIAAARRKRNFLGSSVAKD